MMIRNRLKVTTALALVSGLLAVAELYGQERDADREKWESVGKLLGALQLEPGKRVADIGAGDGFYTDRIARAVAPAGRVTAVDISEKALGRLKDRVSQAGLTNVDVVLGQPADPLLETGAYDAVLVYNSYHEMTEHRSMLRRIYQALKAGGRLVLVEPIHDKNRNLSRQDQIATHEIALEIVASELATAGFEVREKDESFIRFTDTANPGGFWLVVATRPRE